MDLKHDKTFVVLSITYTVFVIFNISLTLHKKYAINKQINLMIKEMEVGCEFLEDFVEKMQAGFEDQPE